MKSVLFLFIFIPIISFTQQKKVAGVVYDNYKQPLENCVINVKGTNTYVQTLKNGSFTIYAKAKDTLAFSYLGFKTKEVQVLNNSLINVYFTDNDNMLNEVVITSLGIKKEKQKLTYSAQTLNALEFNNIKDPNLVNTLSGKIAGLVVNRSASGPGGSTKVVIRGHSSTRNNQPLYVIDGVPMLNVSSNQPNDTFGSLSSRDTGDFVSLLNPNSFDAITVLKGNAATALYGILGANGVILLSTKSTLKENTEINFNSSTTFDKAMSLPEFQTEYASPQPNAPLSWSSNNTQRSFTNEVPSFFETGVNQTTSFNLTNSKNKQFTSLNLSNVSAKGVLPQNNLSRHMFNLRFVNKLFNNKFRISSAINYSISKTINKPSVGLYLNPLTGLYLMPRGNGNTLANFRDNFETFDANRNLMAQNWPIKNDAFQQNPYWVVNRNKSDDKVSFFMASLGLSYTATNWLTLESRYSYTNASLDFNKNLFATTSLVHAGVNGRYYKEASTSTQNYADIIAKTTFNLNKNVKFDGLFGGSVLNKQIGNGYFIEGDLELTNFFNISNLKSGARQSETLLSSTELQSVFATASASYDNYVFLNFSARNDWSSTLVNTGNLSFFYTSIGASTILNRFVNLPKGINFLKLRASYAGVGNDLPAFITTPLKEDGPIIGLEGVSNSQVGQNPAKPLKPEFKKEFELGLEARLFNRKLKLEASYYKSNTENQYVEVVAPINRDGFNFYGVNIGQIQNEGLELFAEASLVNTDVFNWNVYANYAQNTNTVKNLGNSTLGEVILTDSGSNGYQYVLEEGQPFGVIKGRVIQRDANGAIKLNFDNSILISDRFENIGNANPDFLVSLGHNFNFKNFNFSVLIDGRFGGEVVSMTEAINDAYGVSKATGIARRNGGVAIDAVYPDGTKFNGLYNAQDYYTTIGGRDGALGEYVYDATNIILREIALGYTFSKKTIPFLNSLTVSLVGRNLFFISKKAPFDPNLSLSTGNGLQGLDLFGLPTTKTYGFTLNCSF